MDPIIRQIVARCHVDSSNRRVIREVVSSLAEGYATFRHRMNATQRRTLMEHAIAANRENHELFHAVQTGRFLDELARERPAHRLRAPGGV